ncbi:hypothetical protein [Brevundimonas sp.]|uniref:hypothetical protein n=1 Tax=Brevundimonas sp. TaxID=1871086 RepID=UPI0037837B2C
MPEQSVETVETVETVDAFTPTVSIAGLARGLQRQKLPGDRQNLPGDPISPGRSCPVRSVVKAKYRNEINKTAIWHAALAIGVMWRGPCCLSFRAKCSRRLKWRSDTLKQGLSSWR